MLTKMRNTIKSNKAKFYLASCTMASTLILNTATARAADGTESIDRFIEFACNWLVKIGGVIGIVGGVMFALGWQREDSEGKSRGLLVVMTGAMLAAIGKSPDIFNF